jgi:hypothetical protein
LDVERSALIIATDTYQDPGLRQLRAPARDAEELARVLKDPQVGNFEVQTVLNQPAHAINEAIEEFFADRQRDDLLTLHVSCHGVKSDDGDLYFAATNTKLRRLGATAVSASFVNLQMDRSRSRRVVLMLDCCYSGAFDRGMLPRSTVGIDLRDQLGGRGRAVITASSAMEFAFERDSGELSRLGQVEPSIFTSAIVEGLQTGDADLNRDGLISLEELYEYVYEKVRQTTVNQTPKKWVFGMEGELYLARRRGGASLPSELPLDLQRALQQSFPRVRVGAVQELERFLSGSDAGLAVAAKLTLERLRTEDPSPMVVDTAAAALAKLPRLQLSTTQVDFGRLVVGADPPQRIISVRNAGGGHLNPAVAVSDERLQVQLADDQLTIAPDTSVTGELEGQVLVQSNGGEAVVQVTAVIADGAAEVAERPSGADVLLRAPHDDIDLAVRPSSAWRHTGSGSRRSRAGSPIPWTWSKRRTSILAVFTAMLLLLVWFVSFRGEQGERNGAAGLPAAVSTDRLDLHDVCPNPIVIQTDWSPRSEYGAYYHLLGSPRKVDAKRARVSGPLVAEGRQTGVRLEVRSGGPTTDVETVSEQLYADTSITLGQVDTDEAIRFSASQPTLAVAAPMEISPAAVMWDPARYRDVKDLAGLGRTNAKVLYARGSTYMEYLLGAGILRRSQAEDTYDGSPARFVEAGGAAAQAGFATSEPYLFEAELPQWGRPVRYALVKDGGYPLYPQALSIRTADKQKLAPCLERLVPIVQHAQVDFLRNPKKTNNLIVELVKSYRNGWVYSPGLARYAVGQMRESFVNNGSDGTLGNFETSRVQRILDLVTPILRNRLPRPKEGLKPENIFTNEFIDPDIAIS